MGRTAISIKSATLCVVLFKAVTSVVGAGDIQAVK